jgi:cellulose biosynthesis protein BcsQ
MRRAAVNRAAHPGNTGNGAGPSRQPRIAYWTGGDIGLELYQIILGAIASALAILSFGFAVGRKWQNRRNSDEIGGLRSEADELRSRLDRIIQAITTNTRNIWRRRPITPPDDHHDRMLRSIPIISVANLKGGVGKTTVAANLAAYLDLDRGKRVLLVDLDYQGSLSSLCLSAADLTKIEQQTSKLLSGERDGAWLAEAATALQQALPRSKIATCFYDFADLENRLMVKWIADDAAGDIRFTLAKVLHAAELQAAFDVVIIDCPPRMTTGFVNALAASTHLLVPTILDQLSAEAAVTFLRQLKELRGELFPMLQPLGVVGSMVEHNVGLKPYEDRALTAIQAVAPGAWGGDVHVFRDEVIPAKSAIAKTAGHALAYIDDAECRRIFARFGAKVAERVGLT